MSQKTVLSKFLKDPVIQMFNNLMIENLELPYFFQV